MVHKSFYDYYNIGQMFLFNYYTIYDLENQRVGFFRHYASRTSVGEDGVERDVRPGPIDPYIPTPIPDYDGPDGEKNVNTAFPLWAIIVTVVSVVLVLGIGAFVLMRKRQQKKAGNNNPMGDYKTLNYDWTINNRDQ
jgi:hypothetical protein